MNTDLWLASQRLRGVGGQLPLKVSDLFFELANVIVILLVDLLARQLLLPRVELGPHVHRRNLTLGDAARAAVRNHRLPVRPYFNLIRRVLLLGLGRLQLTIVLNFFSARGKEVDLLGRLGGLHFRKVVVILRLATNGLL